MLAVGARGYFLMSSPANYLYKAFEVIREGRIWAPREAVALLANGSKAEETSEPAVAFDERSVLHLLYEGLSNKEIANRFGLAEVTIKARMSRLYRKYGVKTRVQLLAAAVKRGLVNPDSDGGPEIDTSVPVEG